VKTVILAVVLYGFETLSLTLREEHIIRIFEKRTLRIFGWKRDKTLESSRKLHNEELPNLCLSPDRIRMMK
jgi:hypothetical protein